LSARIRRLRVPAPAPVVHLRSARRVEGPDAPPHPSERDGASAQPEVAQCQVESGREAAGNPNGDCLIGGIGIEARAPSSHGSRLTAHGSGWLVMSTVYSQSKRVENLHLTRERDRRRGRELATFLLVGLPIACALLGYAALHIETVRVGYVREARQK